jgi:hypothetical protein
MPEHNNPSNNIQKVPSLEENPFEPSFSPSQDTAGQVNNQEDPNILSMPENNTAPSTFPQLPNIREDQLSDKGVMTTFETAVH